MLESHAHPNARTIEAALRLGVTRLAATSPTPRLDAEVLLAHASGVTRTALLAFPERALDAAAARAYQALIERRAGGEPVAYLTGTREFWSLELHVTPATLIPRPETELLVEHALAHIPPDADWTVADLGTGCGAIALALAHERPRLRVLATDRSAEALAVARDNAVRLGLANVEFRPGDWCAALGGERCQVIVSNPPYVRDDDPHLQQGDLRFEPQAALRAGADGLDAIRVIVAGAPKCLRPDGWLLLEHGADQADVVRACLLEHGFRDVDTDRDYSGHARITAARYA